MDKSETGELLPSQILEMRRKRVKALAAKGHSLTDILKIEFNLSTDAKPIDLSPNKVLKLSATERYIQEVLLEVEKVVEENPLSITNHNVMFKMKGK